MISWTSKEEAFGQLYIIVFYTANINKMRDFWSNDKGQEVVNLKNTGTWDVGSLSDTSGRLG